MRKLWQNASCLQPDAEGCLLTPFLSDWLAKRACERRVAERSRGWQSARPYGAIRMIFQTLSHSQLPCFPSPLSRCPLRFIARRSKRAAAHWATRWDRDVKAASGASA